MEREDMLERLKAGEDPLDLSIEKWQDIINGEGRDGAGANCALCETIDMGCKGCVVNEDTGNGCHGTPYDRYRSHTTKTSVKRMEAAKAELEYLNGLKTS